PKGFAHHGLHERPVEKRSRALAPCSATRPGVPDRAWANGSILTAIRSGEREKSANSEKRAGDVWRPGGAPPSFLPGGSLLFLLQELLDVFRQIEAIPRQLQVMFDLVQGDRELLAKNLLAGPVGQQETIHPFVIADQGFHRHRL